MIRKGTLRSRSPRAIIWTLFFGVCLQMRALFDLLPLILLIGYIATWVAGLCHAASVKDGNTCRLARKQYWLVAIVLFGPLAAALYLLFGRPKANAAG